jgi:hypothetical protein
MPTSSARDLVIELLKEDHKQVKKEFRDFEKMDPEADEEACEALVTRVCAELEVHAAIEEELFYPAARAALTDSDAEELLDEAQVEHNSAKMLIAELQGMSAEDPMLKAHFKVLGEYVKHHIKEEEEELFKKVGRAKVEWDALLHDMQQRQQELKAEKGLADDAEMEDESTMPTASRRGRSAAAQAKGR